MTKTRRKFTAEQKAAIVRRHLKGKEPISSIAEELSIQPTQIHQWVAMVVDHAERAFEKTTKSEKASKMAEAKVAQLKEQQIQKLREKLIHKNEVIAELMEENVKAKKANGSSRRRLGPPRYSRFDRRLHEVLDETSGRSMPTLVAMGKTPHQQVSPVEETLWASQLPQRQDSA